MAQKCIKHTLSLQFLLGLQEIIVTSCTSLTISVCKFFHYDGVRVSAKVVVLNMMNASIHYLFTGMQLYLMPFVAHGLTLLRWCLVRTCSSAHRDKT